MKHHKQPDISRHSGPVRAMPALSPTRAWWGLVFVTLGALGVLHVIGIVDWNQAVDGWWPIALIGWALTAMLAARRPSAAAAIIAMIGLGLLADEQHWTGRGIIWSAVFAAIGAVMLFWHGRAHASPSPPGTSPDGHDHQAGTGAEGQPHPQ